MLDEIVVVTVSVDSDGFNPVMAEPVRPRNE